MVSHPNSAVDIQTISDKSVTCIAVKDNRHQNVMDRVVLQRGVAVSWARERVVRFIDSLGYWETTMMIDREPARSLSETELLKGAEQRLQQRML